MLPLPSSCTQSHVKLTRLSELFLLLPPLGFHLYYSIRDTLDMLIVLESSHVNSLARGEEMPPQNLLQMSVTGGTCHVRHTSTVENKSIFILEMGNFGPRQGDALRVYVPCPTQPFKAIKDFYPLQNLLGILILVNFKTRSVFLYSHPSIQRSGDKPRITMIT